MKSPGERLAFVWNGYVVPALVPTLLSIAAALLVTFTRPDRAQNRRLGLVLALEGTTLLAGSALMYMTTVPEEALAFQGVSSAAYVALIPAYLRFLATLDTPLVRPLRVLAVDRALVAALFLGPLATLVLAPVARTMVAVPGTISPWTLVGTSGGFDPAVLQVSVAVFGLVASIHTMRSSARNSPERARAKLLVAAFGARDAGFALSPLLLQVVWPLVDGDPTTPIGPLTEITSYAWIVARWLTILVYVPLLAYAILRWQLFDIDVRVRYAVRQSALVGIFAAAFFLVAGLAGSLFGPLAGQWSGLGAVACLLLFISPIQHAAERVSIATMGRADPQRESARRYEVYRVALDETLRAGDDPEAPVLRDLRERLGITDNEHAVLLVAARAEEVRRGLAPGRRFRGRYRVVREIGRGASGEVFLARDVEAGRDVAIKRLFGGRALDAAALARFAEEARVGALAAHPNIVAVHEFVHVGEDAYLVMEHVAGGTLQERLARGALPEDEACAVTRDVLAALHALHERGIVHRDVKPSNVLLDPGGRAKLADFTLARAIGVDETVGAGVEIPAGTWAYMAPEVARGLPATRRSDIYSMSATLYAAVAGRPPIGIDEADDRGARLRIVREPPALPLAHASARLNAALARGLAKSPSDRFATAAEMRDALS